MAQGRRGGAGRKRSAEGPTADLLWLALYGSHALGPTGWASRLPVLRSIGRLAQVPIVDAIGSDRGESITLPPDTGWLCVVTPGIRATFSVSRAGYPLIRGDRRIMGEAAQARRAHG
jgi:hypothetical protein